MTAPRVLVAEDDATLRSMVAELLAAEGMAVTEAASGDEALAFLAEGGFDLVITDVVMPAPLGVHVAAIARAAGEDVPILVITGRRDAWIGAAVRSLAHAELLHKPFSDDDLLRKVHGLLTDARSRSTV